MTDLQVSLAPSREEIRAGYDVPSFEGDPDRPAVGDVLLILEAAYPLLATRLEGAIEKALQEGLNRAWLCGCHERQELNAQVLGRQSFWSTLQSTLKGETQ